MMLDRIRNLFADAGADRLGPGRHTVDELHLAAAVLLVEAARMDDTIDAAERGVITEMVRARFGLSDEEVTSVVELADAVARDAVELSRFAKRVREGLDHDERVEMVEMLWRVVYADGEVHDHEANLLRRVSGLLYVSDRESGEARKRAVAQIEPTR